MSRYEYESVWDPVTRIWHWLLAVCVIGGWLLGEYRTFSIMQWHIYAGYCTGSLLLFRLFWGVKGPKTVRFTTLIPRPRAVVSYIRQVFRREPSGIAGHSPIGALATLVILGLLAVQVASGLFSEDDALFHEGPLAGAVTSSTVSKATGVHNINARLLLIMVSLHFSVMLFYYFWKKENLMSAIISGKKLVKVNSKNMGDPD